MSKNRVEELEATVSELESTVRGLTEELVETKERVRLLEAEIEPDENATVGTPATARRSAVESEADGDAPSDEAAPEEVQEAAAEADKDQGDTEQDDTDDSGLGDDIIVA